jgi:putative salt-induced outer membrane protein
MNDGTVLNQKIDAGSEGNFKNTAGAAILPQEIAINRIDKINPPPVVWTGSVAINGTYNQGNTDSEGLGVSIGAIRRSDTDRIHLEGQYQYAQQKVNGITSTTADNWFISGGYDYFFTKRFYGTVGVRVEKDRINFLDVRVTPSGGLGYQWIEQPDMHLSTEAGIAWVYEKYTNVPSNNENVSVRLAYHVDKSFDDNKFSVFSDTTFLPSVQNDIGKRFVLLFDAGARVNLTKRMFSELKMEWDMDSNPAPGAHKSDFKYILGVGITF